MDTVKINEKDNVCVDLSTGHKIALCSIKKGESVIKYGYPIGVATEDIACGEPVHSHNMKTALGDILEYEYVRELEAIPYEKPFFINAFVRENKQKRVLSDKQIFEVTIK